jgi:hypothetical protein
MTFIELKLFPNKRINLTFYEMLSFDFIGTVSGWYLLNVKLFDKRRNLAVYKRLPVDWICTDRDVIYWMGDLPR